MLRVSKRCRLLVSLLLLFGCFLSFSSVSFADTILNGGSVPVTTPYLPSYKSSLKNPDGVSDVTVEVSTNSATTNIRNAVNGEFGTYLVNLDFIVDGYIRITNNSSTDYYINCNGFVLHEFDVSLTYYFDGGGFFENPDSITLVPSSVSLSQDSSSNLWYTKLSGGKVTFCPNGLLNYNDFVAVPSDSDIILPFSITFTQSLYPYSANSNRPYLKYANYQLNSFVFYFYNSGGAAGIFPTSSPLPSINPDSAIHESIESQTQQQQQQYDDFTNDGSSQGESFITDTDSTVKEKIGIFTFLDTLLENLLGLFAAPEGDAVITFPAFSMEVGGETHQIWADTQFNLSSLDDDFSVLLAAVRFGTVATVYFALINFLGDTYSRIFGGKSE